MINDYHVYFEEGYYNLNDFIKLFDKYKINHVVFSPSCTKIREPEKSDIMYKSQRYLLMNPIGYSICKYVSKSFYNKKYELRYLWKLFSRKKDLKKIITPNNLHLFESIKNNQKFKMWYWINPKTISKERLKNDINIFKEKIFGVKFHQYWHNFNLNELEEYYDLIKEYNLPMYLILDYENISKIKKFLNFFKNFEIIFGYGGFPVFNRIWKIINETDNCYIDLASNHIDSKIIKKIFKTINMNKIIFSSDCPYNFKDTNNDFNYDLFISRLDFLNEDIKKNILEKKF